MMARIAVCAFVVALGVPSRVDADPTTETLTYAVAIGRVDTSPDQVIVSVHNVGTLPLENVTVRASVDRKPPKSALVIPLIKGGGHRQTVSVKVASKGARFIFVSVADGSGWASSSRLIRVGQALVPDAALYLEADAPSVIAAGRPFALDLIFRSGPQRGTGGRPRGRGWISLQLPKGVRLVEGESHRSLALGLPRGIPYRALAQKPGRYRLRAIIRRADGQARAGAVVDLVVREGAASDDELPFEETVGDDEGLGDPPFASGVDRGAMSEALSWLKAHQSPDGRWEAAGFGKWCDGRTRSGRSGRQPDGTGQAFYDPGVTGLALRAFLEAGYSNRGSHPYKRTVANGLRYLKNIQDAEGCFGPRTNGLFVYNHAAASMAIVKAYELTRSPSFRSSTDRALQFIGKARNPYFAWRYGTRPGDNDTSVSGWMLLAIRGADPEQHPALEGAVDGMLAWVDKMTDPDYGIVGYITRGSPSSRPVALTGQFPSEKTEAMTSVGILARVFSGEAVTSERNRKSAARVSKLPPVWNERDGSIDMIHWYFGTLAMKAVGGSEWRAWRGALERTLVAAQRKDTTHCGFKGSWDPAGVWGRDGGRVYATALMALCLTEAESDRR